MALTGKNIIGNQYISGSNAPIQSINPTTNEWLLPIYAGVSDRDFEHAMQLATTAFRQYRNCSDTQRAQFLEEIAKNIETLGATLIMRANLETGLPETRLHGERDRTCKQLRMFAQLLREGKYRDIRINAALPERQPPRPDCRYQKIALGPVAVFGASNFPLAFSVAGGDTASALAAGCSVVVKAHNAHAGTSELIGTAIQKAAQTCAIPEGVFSLLYGAGNEIGQKLAAHPAIQAIGFTGSRTGGLALLKIAQQRPIPIPVYAEMSSINPVYILPQALAHKATHIAEALVNAISMGAGQFCTSPGIIFTLESQGIDEFMQAASQAIETLPEQTMLTPNIAQAFKENIQTLSQHATLLAQSPQPQTANACQAHLFKVTGEQFANNPILQTEVFGSSAIIVICKNFEEIKQLTEQLEGQLTAAIHTHHEDDPKLIAELISQLELKAGRILFNGFGTGVEVCDAMVHGGPFPATSDSRSTSVGSAAIERFLRPVCYQDFPKEFLPKHLA